MFGSNRANILAVLGWFWNKSGVLGGKLGTIGPQKARAALYWWEHRLRLSSHIGESVMSSSANTSNSPLATSSARLRARDFPGVFSERGTNAKRSWCCLKTLDVS